MAKAARGQKALADILFPIRVETDAPEQLNIPPEQRRLHTETYDFTISTISSLLSEQKILIPEYQRQYVWTRSQASRLIESLIIQCPIPVIYLDQGSDGTLTVVDGNQRLMSVKLFMQNNFPLSGLRAYPELEGYSYDDLDPRFQTHINNRTLRCITILKETHPQIKFDVFERLNTGAVQLNAQELRHGLNFGPLMRRLDELAQDQEWQKLIGIRNDKRMRSSELILRFFALRYALHDYRKPLAGFLTEFAKKNKDKDNIEAWVLDFRSTIKGIKELFGTGAFRILDKDFKPGNAINAALFDAQAVGFSLAVLAEDQLGRIKRSNFIEKAYAFQESQTFKRSITASTSDEALVVGRIGMYKQFLDSLV